MRSRGDVFQKREGSKNFKLSHCYRVWLGYNPNNNKRWWVISHASPKLLYFFVAVYMDGRAETAPKGGLYSRDPFMEWNYVPPARRPR